MLGWNEETVAFMLTVFEELGFILYHEGQLRLAANPDKKELVHSAAYREALRRVETDSVLFAETKELAAWITRQMDQLPATIKEGVFVS
jgi:single-stranded-DNA-specific exonuclease